MAHRDNDPIPVTTRTTAERRSPNSGRSRYCGFRIKESAMNAVAVRCGELGVNESEYYRTLITDDIGVIT